MATIKSKIEKDKIKYETGGIELIPFVVPLWEQLNKLHMNNSINFTKRFNNFTFEDRKNSFEKEGKKLFIILVKDSNIDEYIGYLISSTSKENVGEVESIYINYEYRGLQIGDVLMKKSLAWMNSKGAKKIIIGVAAGNEEVYSFYKKFGFYPKVTILEQP